MITNSALITATTDDGVLYANPCKLERVIVGVAEAATTLSIYDDTTDSGPSGKVAEISCAAVGDFDLGGLALRNGLVAIRQQEKNRRGHGGCSCNAEQDAAGCDL